MEQGGEGGGGGDVVEEASPISTRPPANLEELMRFSADDGGGGGGGSGGGGSTSGSRWPREETLALLRIRSDMDAAFRDATLKAPLWEDVSRKLGEFGYKRSAKKCKEKFENVQKYYKRTKEGKGGRQDGKAYKFFSELEALNTAAAATATTSSSAPPPSSTLDVAPLSVANPVHVHHPLSSSPFPSFPPPLTSFASATPIAPTPPPPPAAASFGVTLSSHSSSTASSMGYDDDDDMDIDPSNVAAGTSSRKRKRRHHGGGSGSRKMKEFFEVLMRQVLQKQAAMQRSFLDALEKREQDRHNREEAWKRQEMARLAREHELMAQERAASASRDAAIVSLIQKITGHTIQLPPSMTVSAAPPQQPQPPPPPPPPAATVARPAPLLQQQMQQSHHRHSQVAETARHQPSGIPSQLQPIMAIPEQQIPPPPPPAAPPQQQTEKQQEMGESGSSDPASSRWPKAEVLALINLRSGMESKYQEAGPKGPLWEEISAGMRCIGYNRSAKRCKEKWENINKYFKKIKESNKKRPEDAKTCPYFHQLDALYRNKSLGSSSVSPMQHGPQEQTSKLHPKESGDVDPVSATRPPEGTNVPSASSSGNKNEERVEERSPGGLFRDGNKGGVEKPEDIVREMMQRQRAPPQEHIHERQQRLLIGEYEKMDEPHGYDMEQEEEDDEGEDEEMEEDEKMACEIEFQQRRDTGAPNRGGNGRAPSFLTMVQ